MAIACEFEYFKPKTLKAALRILDEHGAGARVLAGGTDLVGMMREDMLKPKAVVDIKGLRELGTIRLRRGTIHIGALATYNDIIDSPLIKKRLPLLWEAAGNVGSFGLRNRATLVGNICAAVPCCDGGPALLLYFADVVVRGREGERRVPIHEWFIGNRRPDLRDDEIALGLEIPAPERHGACYAKLRRYKGEDLAQASVGVLAFARKKYRVAFGALHCRPFRSRKVEKALAAGIAQAKRMVVQEISPITDLRASKEYRTLMTKVMLERAFDAAVKRLAGRGPAYGESVV
ncbi:MAG: xanthine dehydrogenase family protein subunit M [Elusimicrobiota bacterium]